MHYSANSALVSEGNLYNLCIDRKILLVTINSHYLLSKEVLEYIVLIQLKFMKDVYSVNSVELREFKHLNHIMWRFVITQLESVKFMFIPP